MQASRWLSEIGGKGIGAVAELDSGQTYLWSKAGSAVLIAKLGQYSGELITWQSALKPLLVEMRVRIFISRNQVPRSTSLGLFLVDL